MDGELILRLKQREQQAMKDLYDRYERLVYRIIYYSVREAGASEDLSQETFWRIWNRIDTFDIKKGRLEPWIATIARNRATDYLRAAKGAHFLSGFGSGTALFFCPSPAARIERENFLLIALQSLNKTQRQIIELVYFRGMTLQESAEILNRSLPSVKATVRTALKVLRRSSLPYVTATGVTDRNGMASE